MKVRCNSPSHVLNTFVVCLCLGHCGMITMHAEARGNETESYLIREVLLKNYDHLARPVQDPLQPVYTKLSFTLKNLIHLDMKKQTLQAFGWLRVTWVDEFMRWDPEEYEVETLRLDYDALWRPSLAIFNSIGDVHELEDMKVRLFVQHTGEVQWYPGGLLETFCVIDVLQFPMDTQTCTVEVIPWTLSNSFLNGTFDTPAFRMLEFLEDHPEWTLLETGTRYRLRHTGFWVMTFSLTLQRKVLFYVIRLLIPIAFLSLLNCLVFLLPVESGEKMTVSVTVFLSFAVFLSVINTSLPQNSDSLCLFSVFVAAQMLLSVASIVMAIVIVGVFDTDDRPEFESTESLLTETENTSPDSDGDVHSDTGDLTFVRLSATAEPSTALVSSTVFGPVFHNSLFDSDLFGAGIIQESSTEETANGIAYETPERNFTKETTPGKNRKLEQSKKRELAKNIDKIFFVLTLCLNVLSCVVFITLMAIYKRH